jgi:ketosteroid isomerase-like protein
MKHNCIMVGSLKGDLNMGRILLVVVMLFVVPVWALSQTNGNGTKQKGGDEQAVRQTLDEIYAALGRNDAATLDRAYAADYTLINENGELTTKAPRLAAIKSGELKYESVSFDDVSIRLHGDTAVAIYRAVIKGQSKGQAIGGSLRVTATLIKIKGRWQMLAAQATRITGQ